MQQGHGEVLYAEQDPAQGEAALLPIVRSGASTTFELDEEQFLNSVIDPASPAP